MKETFTLQCQPREEHGRQKVAQLRSRSFVPAVVYGHKIEPRSVAVEMNPFIKVYAAAGESSLVDLVIGDEKPLKAIIHDIQRDPLTNAFRHIDFYQVNMSEKIKAEVELVFSGVAPAVKELSGILVKNITHLEIECLPADLPHNISVDITALKQFNDNIRVSQLSIPEGVTVLNDPQDTVILVTAPRSEEELKSLESAVVENVQAVEVSGAAEKEAEKKEKEAEATAAPAAKADKK
jgi:large subunit ribosomal protein L25